MIVPADSPISAVYRQDAAPRFPVYRPTAPQDRRRGRQAERAAMAQLPAEVQARVAEEDEALLSQVTQPSELTSLLQQLVSQQREDRLGSQQRPGSLPSRGRLL